MALTERLGNLGYGALVKEVTAGTALTPTTFFPFYKSTLMTDPHDDEDDPIVGLRSDTFDMFQGLRSHEGTLEVLAEPNTAQYWFDMFLAAGNITGGGDPYTHPFTEGLSNSYTMDFLKGQIVERFFGVMIEDIDIGFDKNKMVFKMSVSARGSLKARKIATVSTTTITLDTTYDPVPTKGFVAGDLVRLLKADGTTPLDTAIATSGVNSDGITLTLGASAAAYSAGDSIFLRGQTPSYSILYPFTWARTEFRFGTTAAAALTATHTPLEQGSKWKLMHKFEKKTGADTSGSYDPSALRRLQTGAELDFKKIFDTPAELRQFEDVSSNACVIRSFSTGGHELRVTLSALKYKNTKIDFDSGKILYYDIKGKAKYNSSDGQMFDVKVLNANAS